MTEYAGSLHYLEIIGVAVAIVLFIMGLLHLSRLEIRTLDVEGTDRFEVSTKARLAWAQILGGAFFLFTAYGAGKQIQNGAEQARTARESLEVQVRGQVTERFGKA